MSSEIKKSIIDYIETEGLEAFSCFDFLDIAPYKTISKCLERMEDNQEIRRIIPGIYDLNKIDPYFNKSVPPDINEVAKALAREYMWSICPDGNTALNELGLSTQVPASYVYISSGPYREYKIGSITLRFKHSCNRDIGLYSQKTSLVIQILKHLGEFNISEREIKKISDSLSTEEKIILLKESKNTQMWIRKYIEVICEGIINEQISWFK